MVEGEEKHMIKVKKRNGDIVDFDSEKIKIALKKAFKATGEYTCPELVFKVLGRVSSLSNPMKIEDIQDIVEHELLKSTFTKTAKAYILYRDQRSKVRNIKNKLTEDLLNGYLDKLDWKVKENSNMSY